ncbi:pimeloyl-ACP methyl ester carboxylesterase [Geodermatophilus normandii]|uniref:Pimeloyl-ACP methyl ester carboxylesterase n=1 Tax=Geodermatophilus normandii TaxID=1137989 RepID=A0A317QM70_9ACTN|nr:alpha/beta fold hydrolase [Geodermatophilus normandii]PWW24014.1 pimeloyl-ACP methyl ester carboxylesterase [Geodermatophilus normandii]
MPTDLLHADRETPLGRVHSRSVGSRRDGVAEVVVVQGIGVSDYLVPGLRELGRWTRAHLVELPGFSGSGEPPHELDVVEFGDAVVAWLRAADLGPVVLAGHSGGTQVAARATLRRPPGVRGLVLAGPAVDPRYRSLGGVLRAWHRNRRLEPPDLDDAHRPERERAGLRRVLHAVRASLADRLEDVVGEVDVPVLVLRGADDLLCTEEWARALSRAARDGRFVSVPGAHSFVWTAPAAWSEPIHRLAAQVG